MIRLYAGLALVMTGVLVVLEFKVFHSGIFNTVLP